MAPKNVTIQSNCISCRQAKPSRPCAHCAEPVCRRCSVEMHCPICHTQHVEPKLAAREELLARAREVHFWPKSYRGHVPVLKKAKTWVEVTDCADKSEALMQIAVMAAEQGFNALVQGELVGRKVKNGEDRKAYQTMHWDARGTPAQVDEEKLERNEFREDNWRTLHHR